MFVKSYKLGILNVGQQRLTVSTNLNSGLYIKNDHLMVIRLRKNNSLQFGFDIIISDAISTQRRVSLFVDVKGGTYITNNEGLYVKASVGCWFAINEKQAESRMERLLKEYEAYIKSKELT